ncbi:MAG: glucose-1-phosphate thymidylyltransferase [Thermoplasmatales archaeon]|nr:glucose-1-phosphate thymidylyltransferase [Thermoplasmatales archaeon]
MKGLILAGGLGTRLRPLTYSQQKHLIPVANKPILFYAIEDLIEAGIRDIGIIIGPNREQVIEAINRRNFDAKIEFIIQDEPKGIAHAIKIAEEYIGDEPFVTYLGDNILKGGIKKYVEEFEESSYEASILLARVPNPQEFGIVELNKKGEIVKFIEKPKNPPTNLAVIGIYFFRKVIFDAVREIKLSWRNQYEITDALQWIMDHDYKIKAGIVEGWWKDTGKPEDILHANRLVLDEIRGNIIGDRINGRVEIGENTIIDEKSIIKGPVVIGKNCLIKNSFVGPYTSIGDNCEIEETELEDSVIMDDCKLIRAGKIVESLIGKGVKIRKKYSLPQGFKFVIGDNSEVLL